MSDDGSTTSEQNVIRNMLQDEITLVKSHKAFQEEQAQHINVALRQFEQNLRDVEARLEYFEGKPL